MFLTKTVFVKVKYILCTSPSMHNFSQYPFEIEVKKNIGLLLENSPLALDL